MRVITMVCAIVGYSVYADDDAGRFALYGRPAPDNIDTLQSDQNVMKTKGLSMLKSSGPSYPGSVGGKKSYEYISSFTVTPKDGYYKITVKVICPKLYDAAGYPGYGSTLEYVNVWIDWNGDYSWSDSECVMAKSSANYKKILADNKILYFETTVKDASTAGGTFKARAMLGYGYNPSNPATYSWTWGDVMDVDVSFVSAEPEIYGVTIGAFASAGSISGGNAAVSGVNPKVNANNAIITGRDNYIYPEIKINRKYADSILANSNYKVIVSLDGEEIAKGTVGYGPYMGIQENGEWFDIYPVVDESGNVLRWNPPVVADKSKYGEKRLAVRLDCDHKLVCHLPLGDGYPCYVFYPAKSEVSGKPMWYKMWSQGVVDDLDKFSFENLGSRTRGRNDSSFTYVGASGKHIGEKGVISWSENLKISALAWDIENATPISTNPQYTQSKVEYNIDSVCRTVEHEKMHGVENRCNATYVMEEAPDGQLYPRIEGDEGMRAYVNLEKDAAKPARWGWTYWAGDLLIPSHETGQGIYNTNPNVTDTYNLARLSSDYAGSGDQEYYVRRHTDSIRATDAQRKQDWSFPGAQLTQAMVDGNTTSAKKVNSKAMLSVKTVTTANRWSSILTQENADSAMEHEGYAMSIAAPDVAFVSFADKTDDFTNKGLVIEVGLQQQNMQGDYIFEAYLFGTNGCPVAYAATEDSFGAESTNIVFLFSSDTLAATQAVYEGPYVLGRIGCIVPQNTMANVYSAKNVLTTKDYSSYECKVTKPIIGSKMSDYADGEGLHVVIPVTVPSAGTYGISAYLATTNGMNLVNATTNCVCVEGKNSIDVCFPKNGVFNTKMSGRFLVRDVSVMPEGGAPSLFVCDYETHPYNYSAFDTGERTIVIQPHTIALSVSEDADDPYGLYKGIAVRFAVNNTKSNDYSLYRVSAILADADGYNVAYAEEDLILNGYSTQTLFFSAQDVRGTGKDGPYTVKNIRITDRQTGDLIDACSVSSAKTVELSATDFKAKLTVEEDAICITPVPVGSGVYSGLKLAVPVNSPSAGYVTLSAYVDDKEGHSVGRFENEFEVQSGYNKLELVMDGAKFREVGLNGPYTIKSIEVKHSASPDSPCVVERTLETEKYKHTQFVVEGDALWQIGFGEYFKATLAELGYDVPTDGKTVYNVVAKGLPAGLQLKYNAAVTKKVKEKGKTKTVVVKPAKVEWWLEGVPTAALDFFTNPPYLVITVNGKTTTEALPLEVLAQEIVDLGELALGQSINIKGWLPGVGAGWTVSGLPTGLSFATKKVTKKSGKTTVTVAEAYAVYGKTTKAGLFTITAKKKKGTYYETKKFRVFVPPKAVDVATFGEELTNITTMAYVPVSWKLAGGDNVEDNGGVPAMPVVPTIAKVAGLPTGLTFAAANVYAYKNAKKKTGKYVKQYGQTIVGTPTKPGTYVVTFTRNVTTGTGKNKKTVAKTSQILWKIVQNDAKLELGFNTSGGVVEGGVVGLNYGDLLAFAATSNATVTASGMPEGIKLSNLGNGQYAFTGFTTKAGTYLVTVKATLKGKTVTQRLALKVEGLPTWAKGTYNGNVKRKMENGELGDEFFGLATVTVSVAGKISGKFYDGGTNWTFSAASYTERFDDVFFCSNVVAKYAYKVTTKVKEKGKTVTKTVTKYVTRKFSLEVGNEEPWDGVGRGYAVATEQTGEDGADGVTLLAWQNLWGSTYKDVGKTLFSTKSGKTTLADKTFTVKGTTDEGAELGLDERMTLALKVTTSGAVTATMTFDTGKTVTDKKTKKKTKVYYKPTCQAVVIPATAPDSEEFEGEAYLFFAPSAANNFPGYVATIPL